MLRICGPPSILSSTTPSSSTTTLHTAGGMEELLLSGVWPAFPATHIWFIIRKCTPLQIGYGTEREREERTQHDRNKVLIDVKNALGTQAADVNILLVPCRIGRAEGQQAAYVCFRWHCTSCVGIPQRVQDSGELQQVRHHLLQKRGTRRLHTHRRDVSASLESSLHPSPSP